MPSEAAAALTRVEGLCGALVRALTGDGTLQWSSQTLYQGTEVVPLCAAHQGDVSMALPDQRALLDGAALRLRWSDAALHARHAPAEPVERLVYELLEQLRTESLAPSDWPGVRHNLSARFLRWCHAFADSGLTETSLGILLFTVALTAWTRLTGNEVPDTLSDLVEATRANIAPDIGGLLAALRRHRADQAAFIPHALALGQWVGQAVRSAQAEVPNGSARARRRQGFALRLHFDAPQAPPPPVATSGVSRSWDATAQQYRVFTRAYDREADASALVRAAQLAEFRARMDQEVIKGGFNVPRLARRLHRALAVPRRSGWRFGQEEGVVDGSRLAQLVSDPQYKAIFKDEQQRPATECAVALLLDCSGSMKAHAPAVSILVDVLGRALDMAGVAVEVLGFSTGAWNGGRARRDWQRAGCPEFPGRLNEQLHLVFKAGTQAWRRGRHGIAALRRPDLFREGMDGEAVEWACQRLLQLPAQRRILMVVSDGCPMDTATHQCNDEHYLDQHLRQVVDAHSRGGQIDICGLGVGLDLGLFYRRRLALDLKEHLDDASLDSVASMLVAAPHHTR
ncbi:cobaltochelatase CobT [Oryzisolibacter propanilivorax]|uniref:Cobaltochelatase CobT n=1 Tax=Oryzisolibacter propanilivorax TaxID=1527607 RepID=A0A1G9QEQ2_9BURK|nr:cobalt chelatase [Oryzisolibacter propanilivorax]SDM08775.1 cobaltochelatase CobT [Oryzisolibacter propanilivorax]